MLKFDFSNKLVLVTAASKGIGYAIAQNFYLSGANVVICARDKTVLDNAIKKISENVGGQIIGYQCDLKEYSQCESLIEKVEKHFSSSIDILVNNAGGPPPKSIIETDYNDWIDAINTNLLSTIFLSKRVIGGMIDKKWGRVINLTSAISKEPPEGMVLSNVTRTGVAAFAKTLSREVATHGITVNTVLTGGCKTDRFYSLVDKQIEQSGESREEAVERLSKTIPVGYISTPEEFSKTILFLASTEASYINGVSLPLDGGATKSVF